MVLAGLAKLFVSADMTSDELGRPEHQIWPPQSRMALGDESGSGRKKTSPKKQGYTVSL